MRAIFLDRDGTLILEPADEVVASADEAALLTNVIEGLQLLAGLDYKVFILTNQIGIARKKITEKRFWAVAQVHSNWNVLLEELSRWKTLSRKGNLLTYSTV